MYSFLLDKLHCFEQCSRGIMRFFLILMAIFRLTSKASWKRQDHAHCQVNRFKLDELLLFSSLGHGSNFLNLSSADVVPVSDTVIGNCWLDEIWIRLLFQVALDPVNKISIGVCRIKYETHLYYWLHFKRNCKTKLQNTAFDKVSSKVNLADVQLGFTWRPLILSLYVLPHSFVNRVLWRWFSDRQE